MNNFFTPLVKVSNRVLLYSAIATTLAIGGCALYKRSSSQNSNPPAKLETLANQPSTNTQLPICIAPAGIVVGTKRNTPLETEASWPYQYPMPEK